MAMCCMLRTMGPPMGEAAMFGRQYVMAVTKVGLVTDEEEIA